MGKTRAGAAAIVSAIGLGGRLIGEFRDCHQQQPSAHRADRGQTLLVSYLLQLENL
jgi:hypothetical protein